MFVESGTLYATIRDGFVSLGIQISSGDSTLLCTYIEK